MQKKTFTYPKTAEDLGISAPSEGPAKVLNPHAMARTSTGTRYGDIVGAMILVMSAGHGQGKSWLSVPYHMLYFQWMYRELGVQVAPPVPTLVPNDEPEDALLKSFPNPETVTYQQAEKTLGQAVCQLLSDGYLVVARLGNDDHLMPTDKLVNAIERD
jgi:hypothetical protein